MSDNEKEVIASEEKSAGDNASQDDQSNLKASDRTKKNEPVIEKAQKETQAQKRSSAKKTITIIFVILLLLICGLVAGAAWYVYQKMEKQQSNFVAEIGRLESVISENQQSASTLRNQHNALLNKAQQQENLYQQRLQQLEQSLLAQQKKILSLSTSTQDDWILAEAEYLLRLANQRVLIEGNAHSALALLEKVDDIVRSLDDPDLSLLRQQLAQDLAKLRLVKEIDLEGIYFSLGALAEEVENLEIRPSRTESIAVQEVKEETAEKNTEVENQSWWKKVGQAFSSSFSGLDNYIRITWHEEARPKLLTPESALYLKQNLRLKFERAQLALLREEPTIYQASLNEVAEWLRQYFPATTQRDNFIEQVDLLAQRQILQTLPDISASLKMLQNHIEMLHDLNPQSSNQPAVETAQPPMQTEETL